MRGDILNEHFLTNSQGKSKKKKNHKKINALDKAIQEAKRFSLTKANTNLIYKTI